MVDKTLAYAITDKLIKLRDHDGPTDPDVDEYAYWYSLILNGVMEVLTEHETKQQAEVRGKYVAGTGPQC